MYMFVPCVDNVAFETIKCVMRKKDNRLFHEHFSSIIRTNTEIRFSAFCTDLFRLGFFPTHQNE